MNYEIKKVTELDDLDPYIRVNTLAWNETYKGIVSDVFLKNIMDNTLKNIERQKNKFEEDINEEYYERYILLYNGEPVGMTSIGKSRIEEYPNSGELRSLYLLDKVKGKGFGKILFEFDIKRLKELGFNDMVIGCLKDNTKANGFYQHVGGELSFIRNITIGDQVLEENVYYYKKI